MTKKKETTLAITHNIFLTKTERYDLHGGKKIKTIGVSLPVWFKKGSTSEPAEEVFCQYTLTNETDPKPMKASRKGYTINMPQLPEDYEPRKLADETWRKMSLEERKMSPEERMKWYEEHPVPLTSKCLLDLSDGGSKHLSFKISQDATDTESQFNILHFIIIRDVESLAESLTLNT